MLADMLAYATRGRQNRDELGKHGTQDAMLHFLGSFAERLTPHPAGGVFWQVKGAPTVPHTGAQLSGRLYLPKRGRVKVLKLHALWNRLAPPVDFAPACRADP